MTGGFYRGLQLLVVLLAYCLFVPAGAAQSLTLPGDMATGEQEAGGDSQTKSNSGQSQQQAKPASGSARSSPTGEAAPRANWGKATNYGKAPGKGGQEPESPFPPFGSDLFSGGFNGTKADGLNSSYQVKPGDEVILRVWGATEISEVLPVDAKGNIFITGIGPVPVQGLNAKQVESKVRQAIQSVYPKNVEVYTNLKGVQPVGVFVTGYVTDPGRYAGAPTDSLLYFLDLAGGIDPTLGSYRQIRILRNGEKLATVDLYDFLLRGQLPPIQFHDGDTIVVEERGPAVYVGGDVQQSFRYELKADQLTGLDVLNLAQLKSGVSHVFLTGSRESGPVARYLPLERFGAQTVKSGDQVLFAADRREESIVVELEGSYYGPSRYVLPPDARLDDLLNAIPVPRSRTAVQNVSIKRESVAKQQEKALKESLRRLETTYLGASSSTNEEAKIRAQEAELIQSFVERARQIEPSGRLVVARNGEVSDIRLQDGDVVTIPERSSSILLSGEITVPQAVVYQEDRDVRDYIQGAGGFTNRANEDRILVVRQNGAVREAGKVALRPGDEILVLPEVPTKNLQLAQSLTQILYQIAISTRVALTF